jgi:hypothetical protein
MTLKPQLRPFGEDAEAVRVTVSEKPFKAFTVMVEAPLLPASITEGETSAADTPKSAALTVTSTVCERDPLTPFTVIV